MQASQQPESLATSSNLSALHANSVHSNPSSAGMPRVFQGHSVQSAGKENRSPNQQPDIKLLACADARGKLFQAAKTGDLAALEVLLATPGHTAADRNAVLIAAARKGHVDSVQMLLNHPGVQINARDEHGNTALIWSVRNAHLQAAGFLLKQASIEPMLANYAGMDALAAAVELGHPGMMRVVLGEQRIAAHACSKHCFAALRAAVSTGNLPLLQQLSQSSGVDINESDESSRTLLMMAAEKGQLELLCWLLRAPDIDINLTERHGATALILAAANGCERIVDALLEQPGIAINTANALGETALICAVANNHRNIVSSLLDAAGIAILAGDQTGNNALIVAASKGLHEMVVLLINKYGRYMQSSLVNCSNIDDDTALIKAVEKGHLDIVRLLIKTGEANPAARNRKNKSAISIAATKRQFAILQAMLVPCSYKWRQAMDLECMDIMRLAMAGADRELLRQFLSCPTLREAVSNSWAERLMRDAAKAGDPAVVDILLAPPLVAYYAQKGPGGSALLVAACAGHTELVRKLLSIGIDVNTADAAGCTTLMHAAMQGQLDVMEALLQAPGIHVDRLDNDGHSALTHAARKGHQGGAALLISSRRVNPNREIKKVPLLEWAAAKGMTWFMQMLLDAGAYFDPDPKVHADYLQAHPSLGKDVVALLNSYQQRRCKDGKQRYAVLHHTLHPCEPGFAIAKSAASTKAATQNPMPSLQQLALQKTCAAIISGNCAESAVADLLLYAAQMPAWHMAALTNAAALAFIAGHYRNPKKEDYLHPKIARAMTEAMGKAFKEAMAMFKIVKCGINRYEENGSTLLTWAAEKGDIDMIDLLLALKANIDLLDCHGKHALKAASSSAQWQAYGHLVQRNANPASFQVDEVTSWQDALSACQSGSDEGEEAANALMAALAIDANLLNRHEQTAVIVAAKQDKAQLLEKLCTLPGVDMNFKDNQKASALLWAAYSGKTEAVRVLLRDDSVDVNTETAYMNDGTISGDTPLILAAYKGHLAIACMLLRAPGIKINARNKAFHQNRPYLEQAHQMPHQTALMCAAEFGHIDIVEELLAVSGIDPFIQNCIGEDAVQLARVGGHLAVADRLAAFVAKS